ncbi:MAG: aminomethyl-transferring glycine dehydrogenase subunit GcvPB [Proteobacteria bacterium]|nr:aminomethyl-transferring glycine dehydrogenase subunit GcvPB [Pseudomonadota bacterium]
MTGRADTATGNRGLDLVEPLIFEQGQIGRCGVDFPAIPVVQERLGACKRSDPIDLPGLAEPQVMRHFVRISRNNFSIDANMYPLGSCTMKHNPRLNEKLARLPGFADIHPLQPMQTVQGALELIDMLAGWIKDLTGMPAVAMSPGAGAHGELCGIMAVRAALEDRGDARKRVLVPDSAHGTNPATAALCNYEVDNVPSDARGRIDLAALKAKLGTDVAAVMLTNPNTCGLFETDILEIADAIHAVGGFFYCDGANFNALVGRVRPGDLGIDTMHINLHKTFSTPHGGGGPGAGPVVFSEALAPYAPVPWVVHGSDGFHLVEDERGKAFGRMKAFHGQMGMFVRALAYMKSHGADGLRQVAEDSVLAANYILAELEDQLPPPYPGPCMHEVLFDDKALRDSGVTTLDIAKALIDEGYHPMTVYFPLIVHGAMLTEPTETETKESLDQFIAAMRALVERASAGDAAYFHSAPKYAPVGRLDETAAARKPVLRWRRDLSQVAAE